MKLFRYVFPVFVAAVLAGCQSSRPAASQATPDSDPWAEDNVMSVLWFQKSGEFQALCLQAFNLAELRLNESMKKFPDRKLAIVVDIDETLIDNSPYRVELLRKKKIYSSRTWSEWIAEARAKALPGAVEFLRYADSKGVQIFYISNRDQVIDQAATVRNLSALGFPQLDPRHLVLKTDKSSSQKEERRLQVAALSKAESFEIVMLLGDNLNDFSGIFEKAAGTSRNELVSTFRREWGNRFIVLPNPMYGDWENSLYPRGATVEEKARIRRSVVAE